MATIPVDNAAISAWLDGITRADDNEKHPNHGRCLYSLRCTTHPAGTFISHFKQLAASSQLLIPKKSTMYLTLKYLINLTQRINRNLS